MEAPTLFNTRILDGADEGRERKEIIRGQTCPRRRLYVAFFSPGRDDLLDDLSLQVVARRIWIGEQYRPRNRFPRQLQSHAALCNQEFQKNGMRGCGVFVEGANCEMTVDEVAASVYPPFCSHLLLIGSSVHDHIFQSTGGDCNICGHAHVANGCTFIVNYVSSRANTNARLQPVGGNSSSVSSNVGSSPRASSSAALRSSIPARL